MVSPFVFGRNHNKSTLNLNKSTFFYFGSMPIYSTFVTANKERHISTA